MEWSFVFFLNSALLGVGLAMDAFSVSMANGLHDPKMGKDTMCRIAGTFGVFQAVMPMTGWICVHTIVELFSSFETFIPWIALGRVVRPGPGDFLKFTPCARAQQTRTKTHESRK